MTEVLLSEIHTKAKSNVAKIKLLASYNRILYRNFPENIPKNVQAEIEQLAVESYANIQKYNTEKYEPVELAGIGYIHAKTYLDARHEDNDFEQIILRQEHIAYFAYLEAYFQDITRFIYTVDYSLLANTQKQISWDEIIKFGSYQNLIEQMIESCLEKSGYKNLADIIETWNRPPFKFQIKIDKEELLMLRWAICTRNIIIHNDAKVTKEYINLTTQVKDLKKAQSDVEAFGTTLLLDTTSLTGLYLKVMKIIDEVYNAVHSKYFPK